MEFPCTELGGVEAQGEIVGKDLGFSGFQLKWINLIEEWFPPSFFSGKPEASLSSPVDPPVVVVATPRDNSIYESEPWLVDLYRGFLYDYMIIYIYICKNIKIYDAIFTLYIIMVRHGNPYCFKHSESTPAAGVQWTAQQLPGIAVSRTYWEGSHQKGGEIDLCMKSYLFNLRLFAIMIVPIIIYSVEFGDYRPTKSASWFVPISSTEVIVACVFLFFCQS